MKSKTAVALVLALAFFGAGCHHTVLRAGPRLPAPVENRTGWNMFWGIIDADIDFADCPHGIAFAEIWYPWWAYFPEVFTLGILSPKRVRYSCAQPPIPMLPIPVPLPGR